MAPGFAGIVAPAAGATRLLKSSDSCSMVTNSTPSCFLKCSMSLLTLTQSLNSNILKGNIPLMHQNHMRSPANIRMNRNREYKLIILPVEIIEMIPPNILNIPRIHKPMAIWRALDEHHWRQIIDIPVRRDLHKTRLLAVDHGLHPLLRPFGVVNFGPCVARAQVVGLAVFVGHAVVVFDTVVQEELGAFFACFPPVSISVTLFRNITEGCDLPWRNTSSRWLAHKFSQHPVRLIEDVPLLLDCHVLWVFVGVSM